MSIFLKLPVAARRLTGQSLLVLSLAVFSTTGFTQQESATDDQESSGTQSAPPANGMSKEQLLSLIANEVVLAAGVGLRNVRLGELMEDVKNRLGPPISVETEGLTGKRTNLVYKIDQGTRIVLSGKRELDRISVYGNPSALVRTNRGARFGMQSRLIRRIYREPTKSRSSRLEYRQLGATFYLQDDRVNRIDLYPASR